MQSQKSNMICINETVHAVASTNGIFSQIRSWHPNGAPAWNMMHKIIRDAARDMLYSLDDERNHYTEEELMSQGLEQHLKLNQPYKIFAIEPKREGQGLEFVVHHQGNIIVIAEIALHYSDLEGNYNGNDRKRNSKEIVAESERGIFLGGDIQSDAIRESRPEGTNALHSEDNSLFG